MRRIVLVCVVAMSVSITAAWASGVSVPVGRAGSDPFGALALARSKSSVAVDAARSKSGTHRSKPKHSSSRSFLFGTRAVRRATEPDVAGSVKVFRFTNRATGVASAISIYVASHSKATHLTVGLYSNRAGRPGSRLTTGSLRAPRSGAWNRVRVKRTAVTPGSYWIAVLSKGGALYLRGLDARRCQRERVYHATLRSLPRAWAGRSRSSACTVSVYVSGLRAATSPSAASPTKHPIRSLRPSDTTRPQITGTAQQGDTLTTSNGSWSGDPSSYAYQWRDCNTRGSHCSAITGATTSSYTLQSTDVGDTIDVIVTATNTGGSTSATSTQTATVTADPPADPPAAPTNTALPQITGTAQQGDTLTTSNGSWSGDPTSYTYQWQDCSSSSCSNITGATTSSYTLQSTDVGDTIDVIVTATNTGGSTSATSTQTATVTATSSSSSSFQSVVFWLAWDGGTLSSLPWDAVTQVDLFSLATCVSAGDPEPDCTGPTSISQEYNGVSNVSSFVNTVHQNGKLAIITIGGSTNPNWYYPCNSSDAATFAQNLVNYMQSNGFDGIDLDIEQDPTTGSPAFTTADLDACVEDIHNDADAVTTEEGHTPLITADVDPTTDFDIGADEAPYVDQFNAMSYGATGSTLATWIGNLESKSGIPASEITEGVDIDDYPATRSDCGSNASWAASNGLAGAMLWFGQADASSYECLDAVAPYVQ